MSRTQTAEPIDRAFIEAITSRLRRNEGVRRRTPPGGRVHIDRQLPFLCVYRRRAGGPDRGTSKLVTGQAAYFLGSDRAEEQAGQRALVSAIAALMKEFFGAFLVLEVWAAPERPPDGHPTFRLLAPKDAALHPFVDFFAGELAKVTVAGAPAQVAIRPTARCSRPGLPALVSPKRRAELNGTLIGLEVGPIYRDAAGTVGYPEVLRELRRVLGRALQSAFHRFSCSRTRVCPVDYSMLGRRAVNKAVWEADVKLAEVHDRFDFLLQVTPVNATEAWDGFASSGFESIPRFRYRPLPIDAMLLKRRLYTAPLERIDDPTLFDIFRQKQVEVDRQIDLLLDIETPSFVHGAEQMFGGVDSDLLELAESVLARTPQDTARDDTEGGVDAAAFARRAKAEIAGFRKQWSEVDARVEVRDDITRGLMVSNGSLLIGKGTRIPAERVEALVQHEVGTHVLTYYNGRAQPFRQLYSGLAGYDALQEGIAVLAEYLVGGLTVSRLHLLAARVVTVHHMLHGAEFVETFRALTGGYGFRERVAFNVTMRVYRGGGLTKDAVYLKGLAELLDYLAAGGEIEPLLIGKIATEHLPLVRELRLRGVLKPPPLRPTYLALPEAREKRARLREGMTVLDLLGS